MNEHWLIVEDALKNRKGHWLEYVQTFHKGLNQLGHETTILAERAAESFITDQIDVRGVLPESIWERMGDGAGRLTRYARVPIHAYKTNRTIKLWLRHNPVPDIIFVPTVMVHHLLGWWRLYESVIRQSKSRLILFFPNTPLTYSRETEKGVLGEDPTARLFGWLIRKLADGVRSGQVVLGVETFSMRDALTEAIGVPFTYFPHPVESDGTRVPMRPDDAPLHFGCYGAARHEKGSDVLQAAVRLHLQRYPKTESRFSIQWLDEFHDSHGNLISPDPVLIADDRVTFIREYFGDGQYEVQLDRTDVMLLPYREPYRYRVSRVVIEAMVRGMPVVATRQTTLWEQANQFGVGIACELNDVNSLADGILKAELQSTELLQEASARSGLAREHFSVKTFSELLNCVS